MLLDASGRVITFDQPLAPGGQLHSASEDIWLLRGGSPEPDGGTAPWAANPRWSHVEAALACNPEAILAFSGDGDTLWGFGPAPGEPVDGPWRLMAQIDRFGRRQLYHYSDGKTTAPDVNGSPEPLPAGRLVSLSDGTGRRYRLLHQRIHGGKDAQGLNGLWGADDGWRLIGVDLTQDPLHPVSTPIAPITLVRYGYSSAGDLITVHDRAGQLVREFEWDHHRISAHRHASGPWHRYRYESAQPGARVIEHSNQEGLSYRFDYLSQPPGPDGQPRAATRVSDSLDRIETYYFEGTAGLSRLIAHHKADGSRWLQSYDSFGRLASRTDPLGRSVHLRRDGQGRLIGVQLPDGRSTQQEHDEATGRLLSIHRHGRGHHRLPIRRLGPSHPDHPGRRQHRALPLPRPPGSAAHLRQPPAHRRRPGRQQTAGLERRGPTAQLHRLLGPQHALPLRPLGCAHRSGQRPGPAPTPPARRPGPHRGQRTAQRPDRALPLRQRRPPHAHRTGPAPAHPSHGGAKPCCTGRRPQHPPALRPLGQAGPANTWWPHPGLRIRQRRPPHASRQRKRSPKPLCLGHAGQARAGRRV